MFQINEAYATPFDEQEWKVYDLRIRNDKARRDFAKANKQSSQHHNQYQYRANAEDRWRKKEPNSSENQPDHGMYEHEERKGGKRWLTRFFRNIGMEILSQHIDSSRCSISCEKDKDCFSDKQILERQKENSKQCVRSKPCVIAALLRKSIKINIYYLLETDIKNQFQGGNTLCQQM